MEFNKKNNFEKALERLNARQKAKVQKLYPTLAGVDGAAADELERNIVANFLTMNKPRIFQVFEAPSSFNAAQKKIHAISDKYGFLKATDHNQYSYLVSGESPDTSIEISFASYKRVLIRPKNEDGQYIGLEKEPETLFYIFSVEFQKFEDRTLIIIKYPPLVMESGRLHDYEPEVKFATDWILKKLSIDPSPISLKDFYEAVDTSDEYQREGFKARGLDTSSTILDATFGVDIRSSNSKRVYKETDSTLQPEVASWVLSEIRSSDNKGNIAGPQLALITKVISGMAFAEKYFSLIHAKCKFGRGFIGYEKKKIKLSYTLEYEEDRFPLIRCRKQGWESFEPAFNAIKKFAKES